MKFFNQDRILKSAFILCLLLSFVFYTQFTYTQELEELNIEDELGEIELDMGILGMDLGAEEMGFGMPYDIEDDTVDIVDLFEAILTNSGKDYEL